MDTMTGYPTANKAHPMNKNILFIFLTDFTDKRVVKASIVLHASNP